MYGVLYFYPPLVVDIVVVSSSLYIPVVKSIHMNQTPKPLDPLVHTATRSAAKIFVILAAGFLGFNALIFLFLGIAFAASSYGSIAYSESAEATVTKVNILPADTDSQGEVYCTFNYSFDVGSKNYSGVSQSANSDSCSLQFGSIVGIKYDKQAPTKNSTEGATEFIVGIVMLSIGVVLVLVIIVGLAFTRLAAKRSDRNNDGLFNDDMPATTAQLNVIDSGMRDLGEFWVPRKMTQQEARDVIRDIDAKLAARSSRTNTVQ